MMRGQSSVEFLVLLGFMLLIFASFFVLAQDLVAKNNRQNLEESAILVAHQARDELSMANQVHDGYRRTFDLPREVTGVSYDLRLLDERELVISVRDFEYLVFLPFNVSVEGGTSLGVRNRVVKNSSRTPEISVTPLS